MVEYVKVPCQDYLRLRLTYVLFRELLYQRISHDEEYVL